MSYSALATASLCFIIGGGLLAVIGGGLYKYASQKMADETIYAANETITKLEKKLKQTTEKQAILTRNNIKMKRYINQIRKQVLRKQQGAVKGQPAKTD